MVRVKGAFLLILAVALILFGVTFINNAFKGIKAKTGEAIEITENVLMPTKGEPLRLETKSRKIKKGGETDLTVSFMNPTTQNKHCQLSIYDNTKEGALLDPSKESWIIYNHNPTSKISPEQVTAWKIVMEDIEKTKQTKLLTIVVCCADSYTGDVSCSDGVEFRKDFILNIG